MPIAFQPPSMPTPERTVAKPPVGATEQAPNEGDIFAQLLAAAATDPAAPAVTAAPARSTASRAGDEPAAPIAGGDSPATDTLTAAMQAALAAAASVTATQPPAARAGLGPATGVSPATAISPALGANPAMGASSATSADTRGPVRGTGVRTPTGTLASLGVEAKVIPSVPAGIAQVAASAAVATDPARAGAAEGSAAGAGQRSTDSVLGYTPAGAAERSAAAAEHRTRADATILARALSTTTGNSATTLSVATPAGAIAALAQLVTSKPASPHAALDIATGAATPLSAAPPPPPLVITVASPALTPEWRNEMTQQLAQVIVMRQDHVQFHLHPADLGPIDVQVSMDAGQATLLITAAQPATRDALELALPQLRDSLAEQGIALGQATVQDERRTPFEPPARPGTSAASSHGEAALILATAAPAPGRVLRGIVDVFA